MEEVASELPWETRRLQELKAGGFCCRGGAQWGWRLG